MTRSLVPRHESPNLAASISPQDQAHATFFTTLPQLIIDQANLPTTARQLARHLSAGGSLFERGAQVVRVVQGGEGARIEHLNAHSVRVEAHKVCRPVEYRVIKGRVVLANVTLPVPVALLYKSLGDGWELPILNGICLAPLLAGDGSVDCSTGYDRARGLWRVGVNAPLISPSPALEDAQAALQLIRRTFASFPFADSVRVRTNQVSSVDLAKNPGRDESAFIVALLTAACRPSLPLAPGLLVRAPQLSGSGTGKGLLVHALSEIAFAQKPKAFTSTGHSQELTKRIESALMQSGPIVFLDNCNAEHLISNTLAQIITEGEVVSRVIGQSNMRRLSTNAFIAVTGNAVQISEDLTRRFLVVNLDAKCENPERRRFDQGFEASIAANRQVLLGALLTIWRWGRQNRLEPGVALGSFEVWASWCRDPLLALGCDDPAARVADLKAEDPLRQNTIELYHAWHAIHGSAPVKFSDLDFRVSCLLAGNSQTRVSRLQALENAHAGGFVLEAIKPLGAWGKKRYVVRPEHAE
jgi:hypothetical protein